MAGTRWFAGSQQASRHGPPSDLPHTSRGLLAGLACTWGRPGSRRPVAAGRPGRSQLLPLGSPGRSTAGTREVRARYTAGTRTAVTHATSLGVLKAAARAGPLQIAAGQASNCGPDRGFPYRQRSRRPRGATAHGRTSPHARLPAGPALHSVISCWRCGHHDRRAGHRLARHSRTRPVPGQLRPPAVPPPLHQRRRPGGDRRPVAPRRPGRRARAGR